MPGALMDDFGVEAVCPLCERKSASKPLTREGIALLLGSYLAHLMLAHWDDLCQLRARFAATEDQWERI
jgi:hypothetical protein